MLIKKDFSAITLVEVLFAIYIFGIGILVIMQIIISNISRLYDIRSKDAAVGLAKEGMDIIFHMRDSNIEKGIDRDCGSVIVSGVSYSCAYSLLQNNSGSLYTVDWTLTGLYTLTAFTTTADAQLRYHSGILASYGTGSYNGFRYNHDDSTGSASNLYRWIEINPLGVYPTQTGRVLQIRSIVEQDRGSRRKYVILESIIGDMR